jgi:hypothetical protein
VPVRSSAYPNGVPCGYADKHVAQIGSGPGQTNDPNLIRWCGSSAACQPKSITIDGNASRVRAFVANRGWPLVFVPGTASICGTVE